MEKSKDDLKLKIIEDYKKETFKGREKKYFLTKEVKKVIEKFIKRELKTKEVLEILEMSKASFFRILKEYKENQSEQEKSEVCMNELKIFQNEKFGEIRIEIVNGKEFFCANDIAKSLGYSNPSKAISDHCKGVTKCYIPTNGGKQKVNFIPESDVFRLIVRSELKEAEIFEKWLFEEVLPTIRKTGGIVTNEDMFINTYLPFADENTKLMFKNVLEVTRKQNEIISKQQEELIHKEDVIIGLVEDIDLSTKRQRITQIVRHNSKNYQERYNLLYLEFEKKYHCDLKLRLESYNTKNKPKLKNKMDYIDKTMNMIPQLYEICCKLFENDVESLKKQWFDIIEDKEVI